MGRGHVKEVGLGLLASPPSCRLLRRQFNYRDAQMRSEDFPAAAAVICRSVRKMFALARSAAALLFMHLNVGKKHFRGILRTLLRTRVQRYGMCATASRGTSRPPARHTHLYLGERGRGVVRQSADPLAGVSVVE